MKYLVTIGLEVHCQIKTASKMFCACATSFGEDPNTNTCPVCLGMPGALPVLNQYAIERTMLAGLMLGCQTPEISIWDRKSYFYPDMPKNYQLTQMDLPLCLGGAVPLYPWAYPSDVLKKETPELKYIALTRIHLEEDVAKQTHHATSSLIDFNRAGTPLMEIVSEPDLKTAEEAYAYLQSLQQLMRYAKISDADMEKGQMRCDVNISVRPEGQKEFGPKVELKNLNSTSAVRRAIHFEIQRQSEDLDKGILQVQSTRRWDDDAGESTLMRTKEDAHDYRYFPCPDLVPIHTTALLEPVRRLVPELPEQQHTRIVKDYGVSTYDANVLVTDQALCAYFLESAPHTPHGKKLANWVINKLLNVLNEKNSTPDACPVRPQTLAQLLEIIEDGTISNNQASEVFELLWNKPELSPAEAAKSLGFEKADSSALDALINTVIAENPVKVAEIVAGNDKLLNWLTGQVMKASSVKPNPKIITEILKRKLNLS